MNTKLTLGALAIGVACFLFGNFTGFFLGVWSTEAGSEFLDDMLTDEQPADVEQPVRMVREGFRVEYPGNWEIDSTDEDYDPDHYFSIDSPGACFAMFFLMDVPSDPAENVHDQVEQFSKLLSTSKKTPFEKWGKYQGQGVHLKGHMLGMKAGVKIFSFSSDNKSFIVINQYFDEDLDDVQPGYDLIENSFRLSE